MHLQFDSIEKDIDSLNKTWSSCARCALRVPSLSVVPGTGNQEASVMVLGQYPTYSEAKTGKPFQGSGAEAIRSFIENSSIPLDDVYFTNVLKCPLLDANHPKKASLVACSGYIQEEVNLIKPKLIICLGKVALSMVTLNVKKSPSSVDEARQRTINYQGYPVVVVANPMAAVRAKTAEQKAYYEALLATDSQSITKAYNTHVLGKSEEQTPTTTKLTKDANLFETHAFAANCKNCFLHNLCTNKVFGEGNIKADIMIVGEAPGKTEDNTTVPFTGVSGKFMNKLIDQVAREEKAPHLSRSKIYVTNVTKCRPVDSDGKDRKPTDLEAMACRPILERQIHIVKPKVILAVGKVAIEQLWAKPIGPMKDIIGTVNDCTFDFSIPVVACWHPAYITRLINKPGFDGPKNQFKQALKRCLDFVQ